MNLAEITRRGCHRDGRMPTKAPATVVDGTFSGLVYELDGGTVSEPITETFSYDADQLVPLPEVVNAPYRYVPALAGAVTIIETINGATLTFSGGRSVLSLARNVFDLRTEQSYFDQSVVAVIFPTEVLDLTAMPVVNF